MAGQRSKQRRRRHLEACATGEPAPQRHGRIDDGVEGGNRRTTVEEARDHPGHVARPAGSFRIRPAAGHEWQFDRLVEGRRVHAGDRFAGDHRPGRRHDQCLSLDRHREHEAVAVIDMLADQVHPAGCGGGQARGPAEEVLKDSLNSPLLVCHSCLHGAKAGAEGTTSSMDASSPDDAFADCPDRRGTGSEKWDRWSGRDILPLWVADMDFRAPEVVLDAIRSRVDHGVFGYTADTPGFAPALVAHLESLHGWSPDPDWVMGTPGVVTGLAITARLLAAPDDEILTFTPVYPPFLTLPGRAGRRTVGVPLVQSATAWTIDWDLLESSLTPKSKLFWLCHPHNPTGTVFGRDELLRLADLAERHGLTVISDEIWSDLLLDGLRQGREWSEQVCCDA